MKYQKLKIILFFFIISIATVPYTFGRSDNDLNQYKYAKELIKYFNSKFKECRVISLSDYSEETLHYSKPTILLTADFDGNGYEDICLIVKCGTNIFKVIAFHKNKDGFKHYVLESIDNIEITRSTLGLEGPGMVIISMADEKRKKIKISNKAIRIEWIETCYDQIYIWDKIKYISYYRGA